MHDNLARTRLLLYSLVRLAGVAIFLLGVAIIYTDLARRGGWPQVGAAIAIVGVIGALLAPRLLKRTWDRADREKS